MEIIFDSAKNRNNLRDHQIDLADVDGVFFDPFALTREDRDHDEARFVTLGTDGFARLLVVAYTYRGEDIRVISARRAQPHERRIYEEGR
jgi:uncharacterized DUF497 family protein